MSRIYALLIFAAAHGCYGQPAEDTNQYAPVVVTPAPTTSSAPTLAPVVTLAPTTTQAPHVHHTVSTTPRYGDGVSKTPWWQRKEVKQGLVGGAAVAGLATFGGLGIAAIVQANKATTTPPTLPPTLPPTTPAFQVVATTAPTVAPLYREKDAEDDSSMSPVLAGILILVGLLCCCGIIGFCAYMWNSRRSKSRSTKRRPPANHEEEVPLVQASPSRDVQPFPTPPPAPPAPAGNFSLPPTAPVTSYSYVPPATSYSIVQAPQMMFAQPKIMSPSASYVQAPQMMLTQPKTISPSASYAVPRTTLPGTATSYMTPGYGMTGMTLPATTPGYGMTGMTLPATTPGYGMTGMTLPGTTYGY